MRRLQAARRREERMRLGKRQVTLVLGGLLILTGVLALMGVPSTDTLLALLAIGAGVFILIGR
jgi:uncharacterized membrane protein HdeD (DUF308 family)